MKLAEEAREGRCSAHSHAGTSPSMEIRLGWMTCMLRIVSRCHSFNQTCADAHVAHAASPAASRLSPGIKSATSVCRPKVIGPRMQTATTSKGRQCLPLSASAWSMSSCEESGRWIALASACHSLDRVCASAGKLTRRMVTLVPPGISWTHAQGTLGLSCARPQCCWTSWTGMCKSPKVSCGQPEPPNNVQYL